MPRMQGLPPITAGSKVIRSAHAISVSRALAVEIVEDRGGEVIVFTDDELFESSSRSIDSSTAAIRHVFCIDVEEIDGGNKLV